VINKRTVFENEDGFEFSHEPIEDTLLIVKTKGGFEARYLVQDDDPIYPDDDGDESLFLVHFHRDFRVEKKDIIKRDDLAAWYNGEKIPQEKDYFIFKVSALIHSGVYLRLGSSAPQNSYMGFDDCHVGAVLVSKSEFKTRAKAEKAAAGLVENWNQVLSGDVYGCVVEFYNKDKEQIDLESCWNFCGYEEAKKELVDFRG
jgi:hypothetical protein